MTTFADLISDHPYIAGSIGAVLLVAFIYVLIRKPKNKKQ
jgi:hypothetical protein